MPPKWDLAMLEWHNTAITSTVVMRKSIFQEVGGFDDKIRGQEDWGLWKRVLKKFPNITMGYFGQATTLYDGACHGKEQEDARGVW
jgi:predicted glycosyltransferase involved in capsule biosynthesis